MEHWTPPPPILWWFRVSVDGRKEGEAGLPAWARSIYVRVVPKILRRTSALREWIRIECQHCQSCLPKGKWERRKSSLLQNSFLESTQPSGCNSLSTQTPKLRIKTSQTFRRRRRRKKKKQGLTSRGFKTQYHTIVGHWFKWTLEWQITLGLIHSVCALKFPPNAYKLSAAQRKESPLILVCDSNTKTETWRQKKKGRNPPPHNNLQDWGDWFSEIEQFEERKLVPMFSPYSAYCWLRH